VDATPLDAGFHTVILHPVFDARLGSVQFDYDSAYGPVHSDWTVKGTTAEWHVTIPANTTGRLDVTLGEAGKYTLDGVSLAELMSQKSNSSHNGGFELAPGSYTFVVQL